MKKFLILAMLFFSTAAVGGGEVSFLTLVKAAKEYDAELAAARHNLAADKENAEISRAAFLPQLSLSSDIISRFHRRNNNANDTVDNPEQTINLSQRIVDAANVLEYRGNKKQIEAGAYNLSASEQTLFQEVIQARLNIHLAREQRDLLNKRQETLADQLRLVRRQEQGGVGTYLEVLLVEAEWETVKADLLAAESQLQNAGQTLFQLTGVVVNKTPPLRKDFILPPLPATQTLLNKSLQNNPALVAGRRQVEVLRLRLEAANAAHLPTFNVVAEHNFLKSGDNNSNIAARLQIPVFSGGALVARQRQAAQQKSAAQQSVLDFERRLTETINTLHNTAQSIIRRQKTLQAAVLARETSLAKTQRAWLEGVRLAQDVLDAEESLFRVKLQQRNLAYQYLGILTQLQQTSGDINDDFLMQLDSYFINE